MLVLLLVLVLENSVYLTIRVMEQNNCQRIALSFRRPQIEHEDEHEPEHDF